MPVPAWHFNPLTTRIMKKNVLLYMVAVAGLVLASCNKTDAPEAGSLNMTVKASIGEMTKVSYSGVKTTFDQGDSLSLYAWIGEADKVADKLVVNGVVNKFDGQSWIPETQMRWKNVRDNHYFIGISPAREVASFTADEYVLDPTQYAANDLLIANDLNGQKVAKDLVSNPVSLSFSHAMAKLNVNLKFRSQWAATPEVTSVATTAMDCYKVNYLTKAVTAYGDNAQVQLQPLTTTPQGYALSFSGLQVPQNGVTVITVVIDGKDYIYTAAEPIVLESGKITTLGLIVGREEITLGTISVEDWTEGTTYKEDGEAMEPNKELLSLQVSFGASSYPIYYHEGDTWADTFGIAENQNLYQAVDARIWAYNIYITLGAKDYILIDESEPVSSEDPVDPQGNYWFDSTDF